MQRQNRVLKVGSSIFLGHTLPQKQKRWLILDNLKGERGDLHLPKERIKGKAFTPVRAKKPLVLSFQVLPAQSIQILKFVLFSLNRSAELYSILN